MEPLAVLIAACAVVFLVGIGVKARLSSRLVPERAGNAAVMAGVYVFFGTAAVAIGAAGLLATGVVK